MPFCIGHLQVFFGVTFKTDYFYFFVGGGVGEVEVLSKFSLFFCGVL